MIVPQSALSQKPAVRSGEIAETNRQLESEVHVAAVLSGRGGWGSCSREDSTGTVRIVEKA